MTRLRGLLPGFAFALAKTVSTFCHMNGCYAIYRSLRRDEASDAQGQPIPWFTYPAIEYLSAFDFSNCNLFEYGCGRSTIYWSRRFRNVVAVDNDPAWLERIRRSTGPNVALTLAQDRDRYVSEIERSGSLFQVIVIDGVWRSLCVERALACLDPGGMIILDNSDWHPSAVQKLRNAGLIEIDFNGFAPLNRFATATSIFFAATFNLQRSGFGHPRPAGGRAGGELLRSVDD